MGSSQSSRSDQALSRALVAALLRYDRIRATTLNSVNFLRSTEAQSKPEPNLQTAMKRFAKFLRPQDATFETFLAGMLLTTVVAEVEGYFVESMKQVLLRHPKKMGSGTFALSDILDRSSDELLLVAAEERLSKLMYRRPKDYLSDLSDLSDLLSIDPKPLQKHWPYFVEAKARMTSVFTTVGS